MQRRRRNIIPALEAEAGFSLVAILVTLGILSLGVFLIVQSSSGIMKARSHIEKRAGKSLIKRILVTSTDCSKLAACSAGELVTLQDGDGRILVKSDGTSRYGTWGVRARCQNDKSVEVRVALPGPNQTFARDPLTDKIIDWNAPQGLLIAGGLLCGDTATQASTAQLSILSGPMCAGPTGTCSPFTAEQISQIGAPSRICCEDGRDAAKPACPSNKSEFAAYWDRQGDFGANGQWVVLCQ